MRTGGSLSPRRWLSLLRRWKKLIDERLVAPTLYRLKKVHREGGGSDERPSDIVEVAAIEAGRRTPSKFNDCSFEYAIHEGFTVHSDGFAPVEFTRNRFHDSLPYEAESLIADRGAGVRLVGIAALAASIAIVLGLTQMLFRYFGIVVEFRVMAGIWAVLTALASMVLIGGGE